MRLLLAATAATAASVVLLLSAPHGVDSFQRASFQPTAPRARAKAPRGAVRRSTYGHMAGRGATTTTMAAAASAAASVAGTAGASAAFRPWTWLSRHPEFVAWATGWLPPAVREYVQTALGRKGVEGFVVIKILKLTTLFKVCDM